MPTEPPVVPPPVPPTPSTPIPAPTPEAPAVPVPPIEEAPFRFPTREELNAIDKELKTTDGVKYTDPGADVVYYEKGLGQVGSLFLLLSLLLLIHIGVYLLLTLVAKNYGYHNSLLFHATAFSAWWTVLVLVHDCFWHSTNSQEVDSFSDRYKGKVIAFAAGFNFTYPWLSFSETVNFKNDEIKMVAKGKDSHLFTTNDPFECGVDWEAIGKPIATAEGIKRYLRFKKEIREARARAIIESRISLIGGKNSFIAILKNQALFGAWISLIFGTEDEISPFEASIGMTISRPAIDNLHLTEAAAKLIAQSKATELRLLQMIAEFKGTGLSAEKASDLSKLALNLATESVMTYNGVENVKFFAPGGDMRGLVAAGKKLD